MENLLDPEADNGVQAALLRQRQATSPSPEGEMKAKPEGGDSE